ncbi:hypothetical protein DRE_02766 [Drechslerella stenobrocha 248]|uniref:N-terminal nucleophile aminohydrolase n=1 Tax=Drechslerella stenobrocha 248 TaxID=1043628 RepID=W7HWG1_9PEZI|nr:hypothetical protein DRE_02766 [Drechslerella stenobrocha 248]
MARFDDKSSDQALYTKIRRYATGHEHPDYSCIFVHAGAGYHSIENEEKHLRACRNACKAAMVTLRAGGTSVDAVEIAIRVLEDDPVTNCGYGSNLNFDGVVEADATIMDSFGRTGAIGATPKIQNPISLARLVLEKSSQPMSLKRVPPNFVVGEGAVEYAQDHQFPITSNLALIANNARLRFSKWHKETAYQEIMRRKGKWDQVQTVNPPILGQTARPISEAGSALPPPPSDWPSTPDILKQKFDVVTDTVGAISIDRYGNMAAASSSGGIGMKQPGRVGPAAIIGVGTFVKDRGEKQVGTVVSGTGEHMLHTLISSQAVNRLYDSDDEVESMKTIINDDFMGAQGYGKANIWGEAAIGVMSVKAEDISPGKRLISFIFGHNTDSFALASMTSNDAAPKTIMSRITREPRLAVGGSSRLIPMQLRHTTHESDSHDKSIKKEKEKSKRSRHDKKTSALHTLKLNKKRPIPVDTEFPRIDGREDEVSSDADGSSPAVYSNPRGNASTGDSPTRFDGGLASSSGSDADSEPESLAAVT